MKSHIYRTEQKMPLTLDFINKIELGKTHNIKTYCGCSATKSNCNTALDDSSLIPTLINTLPRERTRAKNICVNCIKAYAKEVDIFTMTVNSALDFCAWLEQLGLDLWYFNRNYPKYISGGEILAFTVEEALERKDRNFIDKLTDSV